MVGDRLNTDIEVRPISLPFLSTTLFFPVLLVSPPPTHSPSLFFFFFLLSQFGNQSGTSTLLVLTGVTQPAEIEPGNPKNTSGTVPTYVVNSLGDFVVLAKK